MKILRTIVALVFVFTGLTLGEGRAFSQDAANILNLDSLLQEALEHNPKLKSAYNKWKASEYKIREVTSLPDPMASVSGFGDHVETRLGPQENKYSLSQKIPFPGKLALEGRSQDRISKMMKEQYEATKRELIKDVKFVYYDIFWVDKAIAISEEEKIIIESLEKVAQRKYESNLAPQQDVIKAQVELSRLIDRLFVLRQNRKALEARMNSLLDRPRGTALRRVGDVAPAEFTHILGELHEMSAESRQELLIANLNVERAGYEKSLAKLDYFPDFKFGVDYIEIGNGYTTQSEDGRDAWMAMMEINLPIWFGRLNAQLNEKKALLQSSKENYENEQNSVSFEIEDIYYKIITYRDIVSLYKTALVPQAEQAFEAARIGYETARVDFLNWLDAERVLLQTRLAYYKAIVDYEKSIAYLERVVGRNL